MIQFFSYDEVKQLHEERVARATAAYQRRTAHLTADGEAEVIEIDFGLETTNPEKIGA